MTCEFLSGLTQLSFPSTAIVLGSGGITTTGTLYFYLTARNRAGWTIASSPIAITYPANSSITITLPPAARGLGTDFIRYSLSANTLNNPISSYQLGEWENYQPDQYTRRTLNPIVLNRNEHIAPTSSVAIPADLPTLGDLINGQHRLVIGGLPPTVTSSYYKYSQYLTAPADGSKIIEPNAGEKWLRVSNPYTAQITDPNGIGGCAIDVRLLDPTYLLPPPLYDPIQPNPVKGIPIKLTWHNNSTIALKAGTNFGLEIRQGAENRTDSFNGKLILTLKGYTDGLGGLDRLDAGGINSLPNVDIDRVWGYADDAIGILTLDKDLPSGASVVYEIAPYFTSQQFQGNLAANELISTYIYPYTQSGKNVGSLWAITGDLVLPIAERMHVVPQVGTSVKVNSGSAIVKAYTFTQVPDQHIYGLTPNTANQKIAIDGNGVCALRSTPLGSEAIRAIVSTQSGTSKLGAISSPIAMLASGRANLTLTYPCDSDGVGNIRSDYPILGGDLGQFNPNFVRIFAYNGTTYYPALSGSSTQIAIAPNPTQAIVIDSLGASIPAPTNPTDTLFGLFTPPTIAGTQATGGSIPAGSYQFFAVYDYDGSTVSKIDHTDPSVIRESELTISDLYLLNQGWGRPIYNLVDLRSIDRSDTFAWQHRPLQGGSIFYYDPNSLAIDDNITTFKPAYLTAIQSGRWLIRKSYSVNPTGTWINTAIYSYLDLVDDGDGSSYLYINPTPSNGNALTDLTYWQKLASKGTQGIQGIPGATGTTTVGTNPNIPNLNATETYTVASTTNLAIGQYYAFNGIAGTLKATAIPSGTTITLVNTDSIATTAILSGTKLLATGKKGDIGATGAAGTIGAVTVGANPNLPAINSSAIYTLVSTIGLAIGQLYGFAGIGGTLQATALTATTVTLKNIDSVSGIAIPASTNLNLSGRRGATGASGSPHIATGAYNSGTTYNRYEEASRLGASYYWSNPTPGNTLPPSADWQLISDRGLTGAVGIMGATTTGTNPSIPSVGSSDTYNLDTTANLAANQYYGFSGIAGSLLVTSIPTATTVVLQNTDATVGASVATAIKLLAVGKTGAGLQGIPGTTGAITVNANPNTPAINASANYTIDRIDGLAIGQYYGFDGIIGTLLLTGVVSATEITLQNIDSIPNSPIASGTKLVLTGKKGDPGSGGDMYRAQYDLDNNGIVDDATKFANQLPGYYLDRGNHTGTQPANTISNFGESVDDRVDTLLVMGAGMSKVYDDVNNTLTLSSSGGSGTGLSPWTLKTASYTAVGGDRLRIDATSNDVNIILPLNPTAATGEIWLQRIDTSANSLIIDPNGKNFKTQANKDGLLNNGNIGLSERISYINSAIGYLPQHDRLTYQTHVSGGTGDPFFANVKLLLPLDGDILDRSPSPKIFANNTAIFEAANPVGGTQSLKTTGTNYLIATSPDFVIPANADFCFEGFVRFTSPFGTSGFNSPAAQFFFGLDGQAIDIYFSTYLATGFAVIISSVTVFSQAAATPSLNTWHFWQVQRSAGTITGYFNGAAFGSFANNSAIGATGELRIADIIAGSDTNYGVVGNSSNIRLSVGNTRPTAIPTAPFPIS